MIEASSLKDRTQRVRASAFIQKPVDFEDFRNTIQEIGVFWLVRNEPPPPEAFAA